MKTLVIADIRGNVINGRISGHIIPVAKNYIDALGDGFDVKVAAGPAILNSFEKERCIVLPYNVCSESAKDKLKIFLNFIVLLWKAKGQRIVIQQASVVTSFLAIALFFWWTSRLYIIQYNTDALNSKVKRLINQLAKWKINGTLCPSERIGKAYGTPYCIIPDYMYVPNGTEVLTQEQRKWDIGIIGGITANKGVIEAARFFAKTKYNVLIAGRICEPGLEESLKEAIAGCDNIELRLGFLSTEDYNQYMRQSKYCVLNYRGTYFDRSSGVVLDVLYNGTPVLGTRCEALNMIEKNGIGIVYDDITELAETDLLSNKKYEALLDAISAFLSSQTSMRERLSSFIGK